MNRKEAVQLKPTTALQPTATTDVTQLLKAAIDKGIDVESMERLVALHERVADRHAASEFAAALAEFQAKCPSIQKTTTAKIATNSGVHFSYNYAELGEIARVVNPFLSRLGLSYTWDSTVADGMVSCVCTLRHADGHSITANFLAPTATRAGMSEQQKHAAALSYARRQSLIQVLGLTTCDPDGDGSSPESYKRISKGQVADIEALIDEVKADRGRFLKWARVKSLDEILACNFAGCVRILREKGRA